MDPLEKVFLCFMMTYSQKIGIIEGGNETPIEIVGFGFDKQSSLKKVTDYGCSLGESALFVDWRSAGIIYDKPRPDADGDPQEIGIDLSKIPTDDTWVLFPRIYEQIPVYYRKSDSFHNF